MEVKLYKTEKENYVLVDSTKGTYDDGYMLGTSRESQYNKLSIKNCQAIECGYDLDELVNLESPKNSTTGNISEKIGFVKGFQKALEVNADKRFTLKEMVDCWNKALEFQEHKETLGEYIKSLKQTEWDVEIEMICPHPKDTYVCGIQYGCDEDGCNHPNQVPYLDVDGCLILKKL